MKGTVDSLVATMMIMGDTSLVDSVLVELAVKGLPNFWGPATITTSAGEVVVVPFPGLITNTGSNEEAALYRAWVGSATKITATTPVIDANHYDDWQSMTLFTVQNNLDCVSGSTSGGDLLIFHACDSLYFIIDSVSALTKDVNVIIPLSEIGDADTNRIAIISINYIHQGVITNVALDTFNGNDNTDGSNALLYEQFFQVGGDVDSIFILVNSPNGVFPPFNSCTNAPPFGGDSFIIGTVVVSSDCDQCCMVEADCDFADIQVCSFDSIPAIPDVLLDSIATYSGSDNLDSLAFVDAGGSYTTTLCDTIYIIASDDTIGGGCGVDTAFVTRSYIFYNSLSGFPVDTCTQVFVVVDDIAPMMTCPADVTLECPADTDPASTGVATATDECSSATITYVETITPGLCPQEFTISRNWMAVDECGNVATCIQTIDVVDTTPPTITCPDDITLECDESSDPMVTGFAIVADDCDSAPLVTFSDAVIAGSCPQEFTISRTWLAQDACGNIVTCVQAIFVDDTTPPSLTAPADATVQCIEDVAFGDPIVSDNCAMVIVTFADMSGDGVSGTLEGAQEVPPNGSPAIGSVSGGYDPGTMMFFIHVEFSGLTGTTTASHIHGPANPGINAGVLLALPIEFGVTSGSFDYATTLTAMQASQLIDGLWYVNVHTVAFPGGELRAQLAVSDCDILIKRTWTATDECGNSSTDVATTLVSDTTPPVITCPADLTLECTDSTDPADTGMATATDNCGEPSITYVEVITLGSCPQQFTITRTWIAVDDCNNTSTCVQTINVDDTIPPVISCPGLLVLECGIDTIPVTVAVATDNCSDPSVTYTDEEFPQECSPGVLVDGNIKVLLLIVRTFYATDDCGNVASCTQHILIRDDTPPLLTCPPDITIECDQDPDDLTLTGEGVAVDLCDTNAIAFILITIELPGGNSCLRVLERIWAASDQCGNGGSTELCTQVITIVDSTPPSITCPADATVECTDSTSPDSLGEAFATDNCDPAPIVTYADVVTPGLCPQEFTIARTWTATDTCGNSSQCVQTIVVDDSVPPVISCPADLSLECSESTDPADTGVATATDNCSVPSVTYVEVITPGSCPQQYTITRNWIAEDACGNVSTCVQTINVDDTTPPVLSCPPSGDFACEQGALSFTTLSDFLAVGGSASDNCALDSSSFTILSTSSDGTCPILFTFVYQIADECGNLDTCSHQVNVVDDVPPSITCPEDVVLQCIDDVPPALTSLEEFLEAGGNVADNCALDSSSFALLSDLSDGMTCPETITRTYQIADFCGNTATCIQTIVVHDTTAPEISCPADLVLECFSNTSTDSTGVATATDNCDAQPFITYSETTEPGACSYAFTITRTWSAEDDCGNVSTCVQTIIVQDIVPPEISCAADITVDCAIADEFDFFGLEFAFDDCDPEPFVTHSDVITPGACVNSYLITRTWTAEDACGNASSCVMTISVEDTRAPQFTTLPEDITVECGDDIPEGMAGATDNCTADVVITYVDLICDVATEGFTGDYDFANWTATEPNGGTVTTSGDSLVMLEGPDGVNCNGESTLFSITIPADGKLVFAWEYTSFDEDGPSFDPFGYNINGTFVQLTDDNGDVDQEGLAAALVSAGDVFSFEQRSSDCMFGQGATTVIDFFVYTFEEGGIPAE
jgi:hypothetical protein